MAELFYRATTEIQSAGTLSVSNTSHPFWTYFAPNASLALSTAYASDSTEFSSAVNSLRGWGDAFMRLISYHGGADGHLSEEYNRDTGFMQGAADLTWSYAGLLTAAFARAELEGNSTYIAAIANMGI
jgi:glucoamylase